MRRFRLVCLTGLLSLLWVAGEPVASLAAATAAAADPAASVALESAVPATAVPAGVVADELPSAERFTLRPEAYAGATDDADESTTGASGTSSDGGPPAFDAAFIRQPTPTFPAGRFTLTSSANYAQSLENRREIIPSFTLGASYYVWGNLSLGAEVQAAGVFQAGDDAGGVGISAVLRHHLIDLGGTTVFADVTFGPLEASGQVPGGGTRFNFVTRTGIGLTHDLSDDISLMGGLRYYHLSNARIEGVDRNPDINGAEVYIGIVWRL